jgi:hypothetical protein
MKYKEEESLPNSLYEVGINFIPKSNKGTQTPTEKKNYTSISLMNTDAKSSIKYLQTKFNNAFKRLCTTTLGISLYSYLYPKLAKITVFLIISYVFSSTKSEKRGEQVLPVSGVLKEWSVGEEVVQTM